MPGSGQVLRAVQGWDLPERFRELGPKISYDGQVYHRCSACGAETRTHPFFSRAVDMTEARCFDCGPQRHELIVHRAACVLSCADCGTESHVSISGFETLACEHCGSHRLVVESAEIDPPFSPYCRQGYGWDEHGVPPERREQVRNGPKHLWGDSARDDTAEIQREMAPDAMGRSFRPDLFHDACLLAARFIRRLGMFGGYRAEWEIAEAMGCEASLHSHLFGLLSEPQEGIEALELSRTAASLIRHHPDSFAIMESRFAVYAFNLLLEFGDVEVARMYQPGLRAEAIEVAEDALAFFTTGLGGDLPEAPGEAALLRVTLGNLLALRINAVSGLPPEARRWAQTALEAAGAPAGQVPADDLQRAVDYLSEAIGSGELSETGLVSARNTRAGALLGGETPSEDRRRQAIADLEDNAATLESPQGQAAWSRFGNLADLYLTEGRLDEALPLLEKVCALAAVERQHASDVRLVHAQAKEFVFYSDTLALVYARLGRPLDALSALEWSRAATIRFHTMGKAERAKAEQAAQKELVQSALSAGLEFLGEPRKHRETPSFTAELEILRSRVATAHRQWQGGSAHTGFVGFALWNNQVLAVVAGRSVHAHVWDADVISLAAALVGTPMDLSTWREKRFARLFRAAYKVLWQPLADTLKEQELTRLVISAPGTVSSISFEALAALAEADGAPPATVLTYAPSLSVAEDLRTTKPHRRGITAGLRGKASPAAMHVLMVTYQGADLPSVAKEAELLRETWGSNVTILETSFAAKSEVLARLADRWDLIHFAGHGTFDGQDPWNSALHLTADPQSDSQRVTASDLLEVRLPQSPVVVLSACSSALAGGGPLNDAAGLVGALLRIGARGIVASRWPVYDQTALAFMKLFHSAVRRGTSAQASVREAQNALRSERGVEDWAAFSYIGAP